MKSILYKNTFATLILLLTGFGLRAQAPSTDPNVRHYRITAYAKGDNSVISQSNVAVVAPSLSIFVPDAFTPNEDGLNDQFGATGEGIKSFSMKIYDRWGELVFESNDINKKWDGKYKGEIMPNTVYIYMISAKGITGGAAYKKGSVTLLM